MSKPVGRAAWFKIFLQTKYVIDAVSDEAAGKALKASLHYFDTGELVEMDPLARVVFAALKPHIDEAFEDFRRSVDTGRTGARKRWDRENAKSDTTPIAPLCNPIGVHTEADADADADAETEGDGNKAAKPPHNRFFPPSVDEVREYCKERGNSVDPVRFVDYYTANGWMVGKSKMKNWKAAVRTWESNQFDNGRGDTKSGSNNGVNGDGWNLQKEINF